MKRTALFLAVAAASAAAGCVNRNDAVVAELSDRPMEYDEAQVLRDWPATQSDYYDGSVAAGPAYFRYAYVGQSNATGPDAAGSLTGGPSAAAPPEARLIDPLVFLGNAALLPLRLVQTPPWATRDNPGVVVPPTYHAAPADDFE